METLLLPILLIMAGLLIGVLVKSLSKYIKLPYTVALFAIGLLFGIAYNCDLFSGRMVLESGLNLVSTMNPDFILYVFLPILIFDAAYEMDLHVFKKTLVSSSILAVPGLIICMLLTAGLVQGLMWIVGLYDPANWIYALMFGGLISATDPVAVVALLQELNTSKKFSTLVDGESLLNDGTGIVCFMLFYSQFVGTSIDRPVVYFLWVCLASIIIGFVIAQLTLFLVKKICRQLFVQVTAMIAAAYITFIIAQSMMEVSGVIALVVYGHFFAQNGKPYLKPEVNEFMEKFWSFMAFIANTLIFIIVGVIIATKVSITWWSIAEVFLIYIGLNIIRFIMITLIFPLLNIKGLGYGLTKKEGILLGWGGLRGALGMTLALMVSYNENIPEATRDSILLWTAGVVTLTLCINGTTSKWLVEKLGLIKTKTPTEKILWKKLLDAIRNHDYKLIGSMKSDEEMDCTDWSVVEGKVIEPMSLDEGITADREELLSIVRRIMLDKERSTAEKLYSEGIITYYSYNRILTRIEWLYDFEGKESLDARMTKFNNEFKKWNTWQLFPNSRIYKMLNLCRAMLLTQTQCKSLLMRFKRYDFVGEEVFEDVKSAVFAEIDNIINDVKKLLNEIKIKRPDIYEESITDRAIRKMLSSERDVVEQIISDGVLQNDMAEDLLSDIDSRQGIEIIE